MKKYYIELSEAEYSALNLIIHNGWADGDMEGYGGANVAAQLRSMKIFESANLQTLRQFIKSKNKANLRIQK